MNKKSEMNTNTEGCWWIEMKLEASKKDHHRNRTILNFERWKKNIAALGARCTIPSIQAFLFCSISERAAFKHNLSKICEKGWIEGLYIERALMINLLIEMRKLMMLPDGSGILAATQKRED